MHRLTAFEVALFHLCSRVPSSPSPVLDLSTCNMPDGQVSEAIAVLE